MEDIYIRYSPYGTWKLEVADFAHLQLDAVVTIRFEFRLQSKPGAFGGKPVFFAGGDGCVSELGAAACVADGAAVRPPPPAPPTKPGRTPPPPPAGSALSCSSADELNAAFEPVTAECCDEPSEDCSSGYPATCNAGCAAVLLPVQAACDGFLAAGGIAFVPVKNLIDAAAATCPPPLPSCGSADELNAAFEPVTAECCDEPSEDCSSGFPATCNAGCAAVLLPVQAACDGFLAAGGIALAPVKNLIDAAAATCPGGGGGGH
jgi:hypothetical protein